MSRRTPGGEAELRRALEALRDLSLEVPGVWRVEPWRDGITLAWRSVTEPVDRHQLAILCEGRLPSAAERDRVLASLPVGYGAVRIEPDARRHWLLVHLGRVRERCHRCGERMDDVARMALAETCSGCALELGQLVTGATDDPIEITPEVLRATYIARDDQEPGRLALYYLPDQGRRRRIAGGFRDRREIDRWMDYHDPRRLRAAAPSGVR